MLVLLPFTVCFFDFCLAMCSLSTFRVLELFRNYLSCASHRIWDLDMIVSMSHFRHQNDGTCTFRSRNQRSLHFLGQHDHLRFDPCYCLDVRHDFCCDCCRHDHLRVHVFDFVYRWSSGMCTSNVVFRLWQPSPVRSLHLMSYITRL